MTREESKEISRAFRECLTTLDAVAEVSPDAVTHARAALRDVAGTCADLYAAGNRVPESARASFMAACGFTEGI